MAPSAVDAEPQVPRTARPYRSAVRSGQAEQTRRAIVRAASAVFLEYGYGGTTMRAVARQAGVSVPTVEQAFGTKARLLKAAIDRAIAGDDEPVPVLERPWAERAREAADPAEVAGIVAEVLAAAQARSAGLVLAAFEGAVRDAGLAALSAELIDQRERTARWVVDLLGRFGPSPYATRQEATDTLWALMDPALHDRLTRHRGWSSARYAHWFAASLVRLLTDHDPPTDRRPR